MVQRRIQRRLLSRAAAKFQYQEDVRSNAEPQNFTRKAICRIRADLLSLTSADQSKEADLEWSISNDQTVVKANLVESDNPIIVASKELYQDLRVAFAEPVSRTEVYFPKGAVLLNAALACLEDENSIKKLMLDYLGQNLDLQGDTLTEREKTILIEGSLKLFEKKDISINRRLYKWIFGGDIDNEIEITPENKKVYQLNQGI